MIDVSSQIGQLTRTTDDLAKRQVPFATARTLTSAAQLAGVAVTRQLPSIFDRPTPFTMRSVGVQAAKKNDLRARVFIRDKQAEYLRLQETGGTRMPKGQAIVMPKAVRRNAYGNLARNALRALKRRKDVFVGKPEGSEQGGFYRERPDDTLRPLIVFVRQAQYRPRFGFKARVRKVVLAALAPAFRQAMAQAVATAKR